MTNAPNRRPRGTPILIGVGWRSQTEGEIFKGTDGACANPGPRIFPATGSHSSVAFQSNSTGFYGYNAAFFGTFLGSKKVPFFSSSLLTQRQHHFSARSGQSDRLRIVPLIAGGGMQHMHLIGIGCAGEGGHAVRARDNRRKAEEVIRVFQSMLTEPRRGRHHIGFGPVEPDRRQPKAAERFGPDYL